MRTGSADSIESIAATDWDAVVGDANPFLSHAFLGALERAGCVGGDTGWHPRYVLAYENEILVGAVPLYLKEHSYGEYVFDWSWANAAARARLPYYPKLVAAIPFTPVTGPRILVRPGAPATTTTALIGAVEDCAQRTRASSVHWLFTDEADSARLEARGLLARTGYQFHWSNRGYADFDAFLADFSSHKRKNVKRERRQVREQGIEMQTLVGSDASPAQWDALYGFYRGTIAKHGAIPYLNAAFFDEIARRLGERTLLVFAYRDGRPLAGALNFIGADTLYGRYWGATDEVPGLHFETCYYQAIDYCIRTGLRRFEAGAQGEHKLSRGFLPTTTRSMHWLRHPGLRAAIADFLARERASVTDDIDELNEHGPYRKDPT